MTTEDLSEFLRLTRESAGLTRKQACELASVAEETIRRWESGENLSNIAAFLSTLESLGVRIVVAKRGGKSNTSWMRLEVI